MKVEINKRGNKIYNKSVHKIYKLEINESGNKILKNVKIKYK